MIENTLRRKPDLTKFKWIGSPWAALKFSYTVIALVFHKSRLTDKNCSSMAWPLWNLSRHLSVLHHDKKNKGWQCYIIASCVWSYLICMKPLNVTRKTKPNPASMQKPLITLGVLDLYLKFHFKIIKQVLISLYKRWWT